jgi:hypothetical protein
VTHEVVAIQRDVERAGRHIVTGDLLDRARQALGDVHAARAHADERKIVNALLRSTISCAMRASVRPIRSASITTGMRTSWFDCQGTNVQA